MALFNQPFNFVGYEPPPQNKLQLYLNLLYNDLNNIVAASVASGTTDTLAYYTSATTIGALSAITASRALVSSASGLPTASSVTSTELGYVSGVTSAIQTQFSGKANTALSNLTSVAINTSLISDTNATDDLGSSGISWRRGYFAESVLINSANSLTNDLTITNTTNSANASALVYLAVAGESAGDAYYVASITTGGAWAWGLDNSDGNSWLLSRSTGLGTNNAIRVDGTTGAVAIRGTNTNDSATAGFVGEVTESVASATNYPSTGNYGDLTSISLTAGDWLVSAILVSYIGATTTTYVTAGISTTSGNSATGLVDGDTRVYDGSGTAFGASALPSLAITPKRFSLSSTTTVYLKYQAIYTAGTPQALGRITAVRIR